MESIQWAALHGDAFAGRRALVTGGAGFIGSHLVEALLHLKANPIVLDDLSCGDRANISFLPDDRFIKGSILDEELLENAMAGCDWVFHLAALGSVPRSVESPALYHEVNSRGTLNVLEAARKTGVGRVLFAASSSAYGDNDVPWIETMPARPKSPYAATKVAGESLLEAYGACYGLSSVSLRYFNIFGPRQNANSAYAAVIAAFAKAILGGVQPIIYGDGEQSRDFTYVANAVHANLLAARSPKPLAGDVLNVGCGKRITVNELCDRMLAIYQRPDLSPLHAPQRSGDLKHSFADLRKTIDTLDYQPIVPFTQGLEWTLDWYKQVIG